MIEGTRLVLALALAACAMPAVARPDTTRGEAELAKRIAGRTAGPPVGCIDYSAVRQTAIIDRVAIVYEMNNGTLYVNRPGGGLAGLDSDDILVTHPNGSLLCNIDTIELIDRSTRMQGGFVILEKFVPYPRMPRTR